MFIQDWINTKLKDVAEVLPELVLANPSSFSCGLQSGYKQALLDLERIIEDGGKIRTSSCWCGDKYHGSGSICL